MVKKGLCGLRLRNSKPTDFVAEDTETKWEHICIFPPLTPTVGAHGSILRGSPKDVKENTLWAELDNIVFTENDNYEVENIEEEQVLDIGLASPIVYPNLMLNSAQDIHVAEGAPAIEATHKIAPLLLTLPIQPVIPDMNQNQRSTLYRLANRQLPRVTRFQLAKEAPLEVNPTFSLKKLDTMSLELFFLKVQDIESLTSVDQEADPSSMPSVSN
ncbi:hypothetical protein FNV43_RR24617 [Rhamnella rubrinervis]|uniref:Uncharacterized protein n=1 Tax=Rhamnella rubrinervis TaxID=2594499 RepID=A0A8K0DTF0_9ROSA|nr:hypothetical protein FNV43_RR24617 [Rhamnella rubrinervis]